MDQQISPEALEQMKESPYNFDDTKWAAYQNIAMDSAGLGDLRFMAVGPRNTLKEKTKRLPDTHMGIGWRFQFVGWVDLEDGDIKGESCET